jgi:purine-binding chemotaxis protein CheW
MEADEMQALAVKTAGDKSETFYSSVLQLVTFHLGSEEYAIDILKVQEIMRMVEITSVPNVPEYVEGVINLRGKVIPVINLRNQFGLGAKDADVNSRIIVVDIGTTVSLIVDSVSEVLRLPSDNVEPPPPITMGNTAYIKGIGKLKNRMLILLDIDLCLRDITIRDSALPENS